MLLFVIGLGLTLVTAFLLHCDDLFLDAYNLLRGIGPSPLTESHLQKIHRLPQRRAALLIPSWKEAEILERMVRGNLARLDYENYSLFLGVYPNDLATWEAARRLEKLFPEVSVIVNDQAGPTSKAQLLNEMTRQLLRAEEFTKLRHDFFVVHDAEDVMHPLSLLLLNSAFEEADLVQLPLLSQPLSWKQFTAGTYADESAESQLRDLLARESLGATLPSAGAGTALSRTLLKARLSQGAFLHEKNAAENYHLGLEAGRLGFRSRFLSFYVETAHGKRDFIATRKFFPEKPEAAIRQKARATTGIAFQGAARFGWKGSLANRYFLWRDRRGPWTTLLLAIASSLFLVSAFQSAGAPPLLPRWLEILSLLNFALWLRRVAWRMRTTAWVHGWAYALLVPVRWPVANFLNSISTWRAVSLYRRFVFTGENQAWKERPRRLPEGFGEV